MLPDDIRSVLAALSRIPYENLSKAVDFNLHRGLEETLMQTPKALLLKHGKEGTGGTCFSLTWYLCHHLKAKGHTIYPVMCDRSYGKNTHCCAILEQEGERYLLDPGYLSFAPIKLNRNSVSRLDTVFNTIEIHPAEEGRFRLNTLYLNENKYRFTLKDEKVSDEEFFRHWRASFGWESLTYPVVTMLKDDAHLYFQKEHLYIRRRAGSEKQRILPERMPETLKKYFGINEKVTEKAVEIFF
jgi:arylamine N-acetyltransferase